MWPPALIPLVVYAFYMLMTVNRYLPARKEFKDTSLLQKLQLLVPFYLYCLPGILFVFRWVMPWYLYWLAPIVVLFKRKEHQVGYVKVMTLVGLLYLVGLFASWPYFISSPLPQFMEHFPYGIWTILGILPWAILAGVTLVIWQWFFTRGPRKERREIQLREAEARGELII